MITDCCPTEIDRDLRDRLFHRLRPFAHLRRGNHWRSHDHSFTLNKRPWRFDIHVDTEVAFQAKPLHWLTTLRAHFVITRTFVNDSRVVVSDIGDVGGLIDDRHITF